MEDEETTDEERIPQLGHAPMYTSLALVGGLCFPVSACVIYHRNDFDSRNESYFFFSSTDFFIMISVSHPLIDNCRTLECVRNYLFQHFVRLHETIGFFDCIFLFVFVKKKYRRKARSKAMY
jgi:hypothetical protein